MMNSSDLCGYLAKMKNIFVDGGRAASVIEITSVNYFIDMQKKFISSSGNSVWMECDGVKRNIEAGSHVVYFYQNGSGVVVFVCKVKQVRFVEVSAEGGSQLRNRSFLVKHLISLEFDEYPF